jgi:hypothetical protein
VKYKTANSGEALEANAYLSKLILEDAVVEIKKVSKNRSLSQNAYIHLLLQACGVEWGYSLTEMKTLWKRDIAPSVFVYLKNDKPFIKSSANLDTKEMSQATDMLIKYATEQGLELPLAEDKERLMQLDNYIEKNGKYL